MQQKTRPLRSAKLSTASAIAMALGLETTEVQPPTTRDGVRDDSNYTTELVGLTREEGAHLLPFLLEHLRAPEFQMRVQWQPGTLVLWDNRFVQHYAVPDYSERRVMHRLNLAGPPPR